MQETPPNNALFEAVEHRKLSEIVAEQVEDLVISGVLRSGHKLPAERELAELLGVSRPKLREGLQLLEESGLLEVHKSDGTFIAQLTGNALSPAMVALYAKRQSAFFDFLEYRREQESFAAYLAAQRATEADLHSMGELMAAMDEAHAKRQSELESELDVKFHMLVIESAHNSLLLHVMHSIYGLMTEGVFYNRDALYDRGGMREKLLQQHHAIADAIRDRDPERSAKAAEAHLNFVESYYRSAEREQQRLSISRKRQQILRESLGDARNRGRRRPGRSG